MASIGLTPDLFVTDAMFPLFLGDILYKWAAEREGKARTKLCGLNGILIPLFVTDAMFSLPNQMTCCISGPLKERFKPGPKSVASMD